MAWEQIATEIAAGGIINLGLLGMLARWINGRFERVEKKLDGKLDAGMCEERHKNVEEKVKGIGNSFDTHSHVGIETNGRVVKGNRV